MITYMTSQSTQIDTREIETSSCRPAPAFVRDVFVNYSERSGKFTMIERTWKAYRTSVMGDETKGYQLVNVAMVKLSKNGKLPYTESDYIHEAYQRWIENGKPADFVCVW